MKYYRAMLLKNYFDKGYAVTSYLKYLLAAIGLASRNVSTTMIIGIIYGVSCFFLGWIWFHKGFVEAENEVNNNYNLFVKEMRELSGSQIKSKSI